MSSDGSNAGIADRYPAATYSFLVLALSWTLWLSTLPTLADQPVAELVMMAGAFGPGLAAAIVTRMRGESIRQWLSEAFAWRRPLRWYAAAVAVPLGVSLALTGVAVAITGGVAENGVRRAVLTGVSTFVFATFVGGGQEEFGWRGFLLPHLQARFDALTASVLVGGLWALWHAPLFVYGLYQTSPVGYAVAVVAFAALLTWYYNGSRACLPGAMLLHGALNASVGAPALVVGQDALPVPYTVLLAAGFWVVVLALVSLYGRETLADAPKVVPTWSDSGVDQDGAQSTPGASAGVSD